MKKIRLVSRERASLPGIALLLMILALGPALLSGCGGAQPPAEGTGDEATAQGMEPAGEMEEGHEGMEAEPAPAAPARPATSSKPYGSATSGTATAPAQGAPAQTTGVAPGTLTTGRNMLTLPAGKKIKMDLDDSLSTATSHVGDTFMATVNKTIHLEGGTVVAIPRGSKVKGTVIEIESAKRVKGEAKLGVRFDSLELTDGTSVPITASLSTEADSTKKRDAATIAGGAAAGAVLGRIIGKDGKDALLGAVVGGAIGTGVVLGTKGKEVELPPGTELVLQLDQAVDVPEPVSGA